MAKQTRKPAQSLAGLKLKAEQEAQALGLEFVDVAIVRENTGSILRFTIDSDAEGGVSLDDCEKYHKRVQAYVKDIDYDYMEVSSPGADRPLKTDRDFDRALGQNVEAHFYRQMDGLKQVNGRLTAYDKAELTLEIAGAQQKFARKDISLVRMTLDEAELEDPLFDELEQAEAAETAAAEAAQPENTQE